MARFTPDSSTPAPPSGGPNILWTDPLKLRDSQTVNPKIAENLKLRDKQGLINPSITETLRFTSVRQNPSLTVVVADTFHYPERGVGKVTDLIVARSVTPDADITGDAWVDGIPLNNGVNHGNESPLPASGNTLSATTKDPIFKWNLATPKFVGLAHRAGVGGCTVSFWASQGLAVVQSLIVGVYYVPTDPFTESTVNFNNFLSVTGRVTVASRTLSILVGAANVRYDITLTPAEFAPCIGKWLFIIMESSALAATPINIVSREGLAAERPRLTFDFQIGP